MNLLQFWHDAYWLQFLQDACYGHAAVASILVFVLMVCLPLHRLSGQLVTGGAALFSLICLLGYGALREAPLLGWTMAAGTVFLGLRVASWKVLTARDQRAAGGGWGPPGRWIDALVREYFRADPRGAYWLDLARAVRGLPLERSANERRQELAVEFELSPWRRVLWRQVILPAVECRIQLFRRLPRYWKRAMQGLKLDEPHVAQVLDGQIAAATTALSTHAAGRDYGEYLHWAVEPAELARQQEQAARYGRKCCALRAACAEFSTFGQPWKPRDAGLEEAAAWCYETWRFRRQNDHLWMSAADADAAPEDPPTEEAEPGESAADGRPAEPDVDLSRDDAELESAVLDLSGDGGSPATAVVEAPAATEILALDEEVSESAEDAAAFAAVVAEEREEEDAEQAARVRLSPREAARVADLAQACRLLEAYLEVADHEEPVERIRRVQKLLDRTPLLCAATRLLMLYCLRNDWAGPKLDALKVEIVTQLRKRFREVPAGDAVGQRARRLFYDMYVDLLFSRGNYSQLRELFSSREPRDEYQWKILGLADAHLAEQIRDRPKLRDTLVRDATAAFFRARVHGFWTQRYAGLLLATEDASETVQLLQAHPVEFGRPVISKLIDQLPRKKPAVRPAARAVVDADADASPRLELAMRKADGKEAPLVIDTFPKRVAAGRVSFQFVLLDDAPALQDLEPSAGMTLNGRVLTKPVRLKPGDKIRFGGTSLEVRRV